MEPLRLQLAVKSRSVHLSSAPVKSDAGCVYVLLHWPQLSRPHAWITLQRHEITHCVAYKIIKSRRYSWLPLWFNRLPCISGIFPALRVNGEVRRPPMTIPFGVTRYRRTRIHFTVASVVAELVSVPAIVTAISSGSLFLTYIRISIIMRSAWPIFDTEIFHYFNLSRLLTSQLGSSAQPQQSAKWFVRTVKRKNI